MYKSSYYNLLIPVPERSEYILYNALYGGYTVLFSQEGSFFENLINKNDVFDKSDFPDFNGFFENLVDGKYIVSSDVDEKEIYKEHYFRKQETLFYSDRAKLILTIAPTNDCNMACPYCFEFTKHKGIMQNEVVNRIIPFIEDVIESSPNIKFWDTLAVTWYGGEPLMASAIIDDLSKKLIQFTEKKEMKYNADIITNGLLLNKENWEMLRNNKVHVVQVTVDGPKHIHNKSRPVKNKKLPNYETIMENLANVPEEMRITFRINVDRDVAEDIEELLDDMEERGIWPQKAKQMSLTAAWKRTYVEKKEKNIQNRFTFLQFTEWEQKFRVIKLNRYNKWAEENNLPPAKLKWELPQIQFEECWTVVSPFNFVIDSEGYIHKCWETIQDKEIRIQNISEPYDIKKFQNEQILNYDRFKLTKDNNEFYNLPCEECKYLPICGEPSCTQYVINNRINCDSTIKRTNKMLKDQYLTWVENPDKIDFEKNIRERSCLV